MIEFKKVKVGARASAARTPFERSVEWRYSLTTNGGDNEAYAFNGKALNAGGQRCPRSDWIDFC